MTLMTEGESTRVRAAGASVVSGVGLTVPCPVLVGRAAELQTLSDALDAACAGRGGVLFLVGEAGIGKSRLAHEVAALASQTGARVLRGRAVPGAAASSFRPLAEALGPVVADEELGGDLRSWLPALSAIVPGLSGPGAVEATPPLRGEAVVRVLEALCAQAGGLLVLEDIHWADPETLAVVDHLTEHLERAPVLCLVTVRSDEPSDGRELVRRVASRRSAAVVELARLNEAQVAAMVFGCTGGSDSDAVERARAFADGVPFLVEETLASSGVPDSFADGIQSRLATLNEEDRRVLVAASAFGRLFDWRLLPGAADAAEEVVIDALDRGVATQLLAVEGEGFRFRHALTAEAVFESVTPPRRHAVAARALHVVDKAAATGPGVRLEVIVRLAERAHEWHRAGEAHRALADDALTRGALHTAVSALERAATLLPEGEARDGALERLVEALVLAGRLDDALRIGEGLVAHLEASQAAAVHLRLAGAAVGAGRWALAADHLATASQLLGPDAPAALRAELAVRRAELAIDTNDPMGAEAQARLALDTAATETMGDVECAALQILGRCARRSSLQDAEASFRRLLAAADEHGLPVWRLRALHEIGTIALLDTSAVDVLVEAQQVAESLGAMATATVLDIEIAAGYGGSDDFAAQMRHGRQAVRRASQLGMDLIVAYGWQHVAVPALMTGDRELATSAAGALRAAAPDNRDLEGLLLSGEALAALAADDLDGALIVAERGAERLRGSQTAPPAHFRSIWPVLLALKNRPEAASAIDEIEASGVSVNRGGRGWLHLARAILTGRSDPDGAYALAIEVDDLLVPFPMWRHLGRRVAAEAATNWGWSVPTGWLGESEAWFRDHGYTAAAAACGRLRGRDTPAEIPPAWAALGITRREADVLALVVEGCSNREIAERLYLSVRTVEKHVESLLRKTSTRTRTQLARLAST
jgi:DNA-binding CsgD family transcriptional regulator